MPLKKKKIEVGPRTQPLPQTPYNVYSLGLWERAEIWILFLQWSKCIPIKGKFVQKGSSGICFDYGQFEIKTFPIYAPP